MNLRIALVCLLAMVLTACVAPYQSVTDGPSAKITFKTEASGTSVLAPKTEECFASGGAAHYQSVWGAHKVNNIGFISPGNQEEITGWDKFMGINYEKSIHVRADEEFKFYVQGVTEYIYPMTYSCGLMSGFTPKSSAEYNVMFVVSGRACGAVIKETLGNDVVVLREPEVKRYDQCP